MAVRIALLVAAALCTSCGGIVPSADDLRNDPHGHLVWAARTGDVAAIRALAASGVDLDASPRTALRFVFPDVDHRAWTALQHAAGKHQADAVRVLLEWGADPDARESGATPLAIAASNGDHAAIALLLNAGADVEQSWKAADDDEGNPVANIIAYVFDVRR